MKPEYWLERWQEGILGWLGPTYDPRAFVELYPRANINHDERYVRAREFKKTAMIGRSHGTQSEGRDMAERLRRGEVPVVARVENGALLLDVRCVRPDQEEPLARAVAAAMQPR